LNLAPLQPNPTDLLATPINLPCSSDFQEISAEAAAIQHPIDMSLKDVKQEDVVDDFIVVSDDISGMRKFTIYFRNIGLFVTIVLTVPEIRVNCTCMGNPIQFKFV